MNAILSIVNQEQETWKRIFPFLCILLTIGFAFPGLLNYLKPDLNLFLVLIAAPFVIQVKRPGEFSSRYAILTLIFLGLFVLMKMRILFLFSIGSALLYFIESHKGRLSVLPLTLVFFLSPVPAYLAEVFTFPIRLWMSKQTAGILTQFGYEVAYQGNIFTVGDHSFSVDPACMGLNSLVTGIILMILLIAFAEQKHKRSLRFFQIVGLGIVSLLLLIGSNFFRMIGLVLFLSPAETLGHELIGLSSLIVYAIVPIYFLVNWGVKHKGRTSIISHKSRAVPNSTFLLSALLLISIGILSSQRKSLLDQPVDTRFSNIELAGLEKSDLEGGISKFENEELLVYIKAPSRFWGSDHSPAICWKASGFKFAQVEEFQLGGQSIYLGQLKRGKEMLHTAWWYDNGETQTHSQIDWRIRRLQGEKPFLLINVTAEEKDEVLNYSKSLLTIPFQN